jgi:CTP:molybdopterin cytidylyltransferase MocA
MPLTVVILAAGQGKRMGSDLPKVLQPLAGRPLLAHVVETARALGPAAIHVVYGHGGELVRAAFAGTELGWALQAEQKGTGHALMQAMPAVPRAGVPRATTSSRPSGEAPTVGQPVSNTAAPSDAARRVACAYGSSRTAPFGTPRIREVFPGW